jgi:hypothetical protein
MQYVPQNSTSIRQREVQSFEIILLWDMTKFGPYLTKPLEMEAADSSEMLVNVY